MVAKLDALKNEQTIFYHQQILRKKVIQKKIEN